jgi:hypothetical protein
MPKPLVLHGLPITPARLLEQLRGENFCVSFAAPYQIEQAMKLQDPAGMMMLDNGAFSHWRSGKGRIDAQAFFRWANIIQYRCPAAVAVVPDVIEGSEAQNWEEAELAIHELAVYPERLMFVWHLNDSLETLANAVREFNYIAFGSCAEYDVQRKRLAYLDRLAEARAVIADLEVELGRRPWIHLMRGVAALPHAMWVDSADSTNIARNHCRTKGRPNHVRVFADRIQATIDRAEVVEREIA